MVAGRAAVISAGKLNLDGDASVLQTYAVLLDEFDPNFAIVVP